MRLFLIHKMCENVTFWSQFEGEYVLVRWIRSSCFLLGWKKRSKWKSWCFLACLSCVSGSWRLAPTGRDQDTESERSLWRHTEACAQKCQCTYQPWSEGTGQKPVFECGGAKQIKCLTAKWCKFSIFPFILLLFSLKLLYFCFLCYYFIVGIFSFAPSDEEAVIQTVSWTVFDQRQTHSRNTY